MLTELHISNFAIIDELRIEFGSGLNILTGETGAGKSILLKSLGLLMGLKAHADHIRHGKPFALVEGSFDLSDRKDVLAKLEGRGISCPEKSLLIRRVLTAEKSKVYLNGQLSSLSDLRDLVSPLLEVGSDSAPLIEMTGQFENRDLLSSQYQLDLLDSFSGLWEERETFRSLYDQYKDLQGKIHNFHSQDGNRQQKLDFLRFQRDEIAKLNLSPGEEFQLESDMSWLKSLRQRVQVLRHLENLIDGDHGGSGSGDSAGWMGIMSTLKHTLNSQKTLLSEEVLQRGERLSLAEEVVEQFLSSLQQELKSLESEALQADDRLEELETKFSLLRKLQRKYGAQVSDILAHLLQVETEISKLETSEQNLHIWKKELVHLEDTMTKKSEILHKKRTEFSLVLMKKVNQELKDLNMKGLRFVVSLEKSDGFLPTGASRIEFQSRIEGAGESSARSLKNFASGGELSRFLLAIKQVVGTSHFPRTYLFDEVDTGVSGPTAEKVGRKLAHIARGQQVLCVTHLPQVAAFADQHFVIRKTVAGGEALMVLEDLDEDGQIQELARLISGSKLTTQGLQHAQQLLVEAQAVKNESQSVAKKLPRRLRTGSSGRTTGTTGITAITGRTESTGSSGSSGSSGALALSRVARKAVLGLLLVCTFTVLLFSVEGRSDWSLNLGYNNPPLSRVGFNFMYMFQNWAFETGVGSMNLTSTDSETGESSSRMGLGGDIGFKYLFSGSTFRPFLEIGTGATAGASSSGVAGGLRGFFGGAGLFLWSSSVYAYLGLVGTSNMGFQAGLGFHF